MIRWLPYSKILGEGGDSLVSGLLDSLLISTPSLFSFSCFLCSLEPH